MIRKWLNYLNIIPCRKCGSRDFKEACVDWLGYIELEKEVRCNKCGFIVNYWVTGYYELPWEFTELFRMPIKEIVDYFKYR